MPRKPVPLFPSDPYHISARCLNREWFCLPLPVVWELMEEYLFLISKMYNLKIHAFVLMSNHFHLLVTAPDGNMSSALLYFMRETSKQISRLSGRINQTYGSRYHKTYIGNFHYFMNSYKYVYQNPLRAGICEKVEDYQFSTLHGLVGKGAIRIPLVEDTILFTPSFDFKILEWLNERPGFLEEETMRLALRRPEFSIKTLQKIGSLSRLNDSLL